MALPTPTPAPTFVPAPPPELIIAYTVAVRVDSDGSVGKGWCTDFVWSRGWPHSIYSGDANTWKRFINTENPRAGDVVVLREGGKRGHVAIIESVASTSINLIEQNFVGLGVVSRRTIPKDYARIVGFIMPP